MQKLSIIIPVYNEEKTILKVIAEVKKVKINNVEKEIVIVDDFSTDKTRHILKKIKEKSIENLRFSGHRKSKGFSCAIKIFCHSKNMGKGAAIRTALRHAVGDVISIQDADLEYAPSNIAKLIKPILNGDADIVYGSRFLGKKLSLFGKKKTLLPLHWIGNRGLTFITNMLYFSSLTDMETGCKVFKKDVVKNIKLRAARFDFEPEITAKILKRGYKIKELPIDFNPRTFKEGKKITWRDGIKAVYYLIKYRFVD